MIKITKNKNMLTIVLIIIIPPIIILGLYFHQKNAISNSYIYDFEGDKIGSYPDGFVGTGRRYELIEVVKWDVQDGHQGKVVKVSYIEENKINGIELNLLFKKATIGIIEFDLYGVYQERINLAVCQEDVIYDYKDDINIRIFKSGDKKLYCMNRFGSYEDVRAFLTKQWYHFKITFDIDEGWEIWVNGVFQEFDYYYQGNYFSQLYFATYVINNVFFLDNIKIKTIQEYKV